MADAPQAPLLDDDFMADLRREFAAKCRDDLGALQRAAAAADWATIAAVAHDIKGTAPVFGHDDAGATAQRLETAARAARADDIAGLLAELAAQLPT